MASQRIYLQCFRHIVNGKLTPYTLSKKSSNLLPAFAAYSTSNAPENKLTPGSKKYKVVVVGGGSGGCAVAAKCVRGLRNEKHSVAVIEPSTTHYYQPMWTLVGAGIKGIQQSANPMGDVLPAGCHWYKDRAVLFEPSRNMVQTAKGDQIFYDYLVVAMGIQINLNQVQGLVDALDNDPQVCTNYLDRYVTKTMAALQRFQRGNAIFTFPNTPIKCAGAPQKIMYLAEEYFRKSGKRESANVIYNTALPVIFGVPKYAASLMQVARNRKIQVNYQLNLCEVNHQRKEAVFEVLGKSKEAEIFKYDFLHVTPPMSAPDVLRNSPLANEAGWLDVNKFTLQHNVHKNIFGIGDCTSLPTSKTAAAAAAQCSILYNNMWAVMNGKEMPEKKYDGYTSCPLITSSETCILAEFDYDAHPMETFPIDQGQERKLMYFMKAEVMPTLYWRMMLNGWWNGPRLFRKLLHLGFDDEVKKKTNEELAKTVTAYDGAQIKKE